MLGVRQIDDAEMNNPEAVTNSSGRVLPGPSRVGAELRAARERLGWDLGLLATDLRIRLAYLQALEAGKIDELPAPVYALGFVRSYAKSLGLPAETLCRRFREELGAASLEPELVFPTPIRSRTVPFGAAALIAVALAVGGYTAWYKISENRPGEVASVPPVPERLAPLAEPSMPPGPPGPPGSPAPAVVASGNNAAGNAADDGSVSPTQAAAIGVANPAPAYEQAAGTAATSRVMLHANADSWLQVHDGNGNLLFSRILKAGDSWQLPGGSGPLYLTTGNAGGTDVLVDGKATASLGGFGVVRHDLPLDPDQVKEGKLALPTPDAVSSPTQTD